MISVVLSRPKEFHIASWLIQKATRFDSSHASIHLLGSGLFAGQHMIFESTTHGIGLTHPDVWHAKSEPVHTFRLKSKHLIVGKNALGEMWKHLGGDYDYKGLLHFGLRLFMSKLCLTKLATVDTPNQMFCSELVARWLNNVKEQLDLEPGSLSPEEVSPAGLYKELYNSELFDVIL